MRVHFICLGNAYRSPMAEAYMKSYLDDQGIEGVDVVSSGTIASDRYEYTRPVAANTLKFLGSKGLGEYAKPDSDQLIQEHIQPDDITICMNPIVRESCDSQRLQLPETTYIWDITDSDEGDQPAPVPGDEAWLKHTDHIYGQIIESVHELVRQQVT